MVTVPVHVYLSMFEYTLVFLNTAAHANADAFSLLPLPEKPEVHLQPAELILLTTYFNNYPVSSAQIAEATRKDPVLSTVAQYVSQGWPRSIPSQPHLSTHFDKKEELSLFEGCPLWGARVIIPETCREAVLAQLHEGHQGMVRTKSLAHMYVWWPGMDRDIDRHV